MSPDVAIHKLLAQLMTNTTFPNADGDMNTARIKKMMINKNCRNEYHMSGMNEVILELVTILLLYFVNHTCSSTPYCPCRIHLYKHHIQCLYMLQHMVTLYHPDMLPEDHIQTLVANLQLHKIQQVATLDFLQDKTHHEDTERSPILYHNILFDTVILYTNKDIRAFIRTVIGGEDRFIHILVSSIRVRH